MITAEMIYRAFISQGLANARENKDQLEALFDQHDVLKSGRDKHTEFRPSHRLHTWLREYPRIPVDLHYPRAQEQRPCIHIATARADDSKEVFPNVGHRVVKADADNADLGYDNGDGTITLLTSEQIGPVLDVMTQVIVSTRDQDFTNYLTSLVFWTLYLGSLRMESNWHLYDMQLGMSDVSLPPDKAPPDTYNRAITVRARQATPVDMSAYYGHVDDEEYWRANTPCIARFILQLADGTDALILDGTNGQVVYPNED